jgi:UPF0716 family protein affecting phage T7 exclusion
MAVIVLVARVLGFSVLLARVLGFSVLGFSVLPARVPLARVLVARVLVPGRRAGRPAGPGHPRAVARAGSGDRCAGRARSGG